MASKVTLPPWHVPFLDKAGLVDRAWQSWMRETFTRSGGNSAMTNTELEAAIDEARLLASAALLQSTGRDGGEGVTRADVLALIASAATRARPSSGIDWQTAMAAQMIAPRSRGGGGAAGLTVVDLAADVTGLLPIANGGTGSATGANLVPAIASNALLANTTGGSAIPVSTTLSALLDAALGSTRGQIIQRGASAWAALNPSGGSQFLACGGPGADNYWASIATSDQDQFVDNVVLHLYGYGFNNSTLVRDSSPGRRTVAVAGAAKISTAQFKFSPSSLYFDGSAGCRLNVTVVAADFSSSAVVDLCFQSWIYFPAAPGASIQMIFETASASGFAVYRRTDGKLACAKSSVVELLASGSAIPVASWVFLEVCRVGGTLRLFINGTLDGSVADTTAFTAGTTTTVGGNGSNANVVGYIQDLRFTNGIGRNTVSYTPPTIPMPRI